MENNENNRSYKSLQIGIIGSIIGGLIVYWLLKQQFQQSPVMTQFYQMQNRIQQLEYQLYRQQYQQYQQDQQYQQYQQYQQPILSATTGSSSSYKNSYKNNEKWVITRDKTGHIDSLEIVRDAKFNR